MNAWDQMPLPGGLDEDLDLIDHLVGGTRKMREAGKRYLPQRAMEENKDYEKRLIVSTLFPAFTETLSVMTGRVFADPIQYGDNVPKWMLDEVLVDVDKQGRNLHVFAREWFLTALTYGLSHVLVDSPPAEGQQTVEQARAAGIRPYLVHIKPRQVLGFRAQNGILSQLRVKFLREADDGEFGSKQTEEVRIYTVDVDRVNVRVLTKDGANWQEGDPQVINQSRIPLVTFYTGRTGLMTAAPPLRELAYLNQKHWVMQSGHDELVVTAQVPILFMRGITDGDKVVIGSKSAIRSDSPTAEMRYIEHTGAAIKSGREALEALKDEMRQSGAKLLVPQGVTKTATQAEEEANRENSALGSMAQDFEDALDDLLDTIAAWRGETDGGSAKLRPNLDPDMAPADSMRVVLEMRRDGVLSDKTSFEEGRRRGFVSDEVTWEDEQARIEAQGPSGPGALADLRKQRPTFDDGQAVA